MKRYQTAARACHLEKRTVCEELVHGERRVVRIPPEVLAEWNPAFWQRDGWVVQDCGVPLAVLAGDRRGEPVCCWRSEELEDHVGQHSY